MVANQPKHCTHCAPPLQPPPPSTLSILPSGFPGNCCRCDSLSHSVLIWVPNSKQTGADSIESHPFVHVLPSSRSLPCFLLNVFDLFTPATVFSLHHSVSVSDPGSHMQLSPMHFICIGPTSLLNAFMHPALVINTHTLHQSLTYSFPSTRDPYAPHKLFAYSSSSVCANNEKFSFGHACGYDCGVCVCVCMCVRFMHISG